MGTFTYKNVSTIFQLCARKISSSERKHVTLHSSQKNNHMSLYISLLPLCERTAYSRWKRTKVNPTPKIASPIPPIHKPSAYWCAPQRVISIQNEQKIALKIQRCSLPCSGMLFTDSNSLSWRIRGGGFAWLFVTFVWLSVHQKSPNNLPSRLGLFLL